MTDQLPSKDQLPNVTLTPEQEARANVMADQMSASYWGYRSSARWIVHLLDQVATTTGEAAALERKLDTCGLECSSTLKSLVAENEELRRELAAQPQHRLETITEGAITHIVCTTCKRMVGGNPMAMATAQPPESLEAKVGALLLARGYLDRMKDQTDEDTAARIVYEFLAEARPIISAHYGRTPPPGDG